MIKECVCYTLLFESALTIYTDTLLIELAFKISKFNLGPWL